MFMSNRTRRALIAATALTTTAVLAVLVMAAVERLSDIGDRSK